MEQEKKLFPLKLLALSLGLLLLGAVVMLGSVALQHTPIARSCTGGKVDFTQRGQISGVRTENGDIMVILRKESNNSIDVVTLDGCTGKEKSTISMRGQ